MSDLNPETVSGIVEGTLNSVVKSIVESTDRLRKDIKRLIFDTFRNYLSRRYNSLSEVKNILYKNKAEPIRSFYVDLEIKYNGGIINTENVSSLLDSRNRIIIKGPAGCGKSLLSRVLFMRLVEDGGHGVPIHLKLRRMNDEKDMSIRKKVLMDVRSFDDTFDGEYLESCLSKGSFAFILDGLDEVKPDKREQIERDIMEVADKYPDNKMILFTRPASSVEGWDEFTTMSVRGLTREKAIELVKNVKYDEEVKREFLSELKDDLFYRYRDFLSNPLLLTMMLITYSETSGIPSKMHVYYERVFGVLFDQHDISKGRYKRVRYTDLSLDVFIRIISAFSFITYFESVTLSKAKTLEKIKQAIDLSNVENPPEPKSYLNDLTESVCILIKDGLEYRFTHRSFQEYFTAVFISNSKSKEKRQIIERLSRTQNMSPRVANSDIKRNKTDGFNLRSELTLYLLYGMDPSSVDRGFFIPFLEDLISHVNELKERGDKFQFISSVHPSIDIVIYEEDKINVGLSVYVSTGKSSSYSYGPHIHSIYSCYPSFWGNLFDLEDHVEEWLLNSITREDVEDNEGSIRIDYGQDIDGQIPAEKMNLDWYLQEIPSSAKQNLEHLKEKYSSTDESIKSIIDD